MQYYFFDDFLHIKRKKEILMFSIKSFFDNIYYEKYNKKKKKEEERLGKVVTRNMLKRGCALEEIADQTGIDIVQIQLFADEIRKEAI